MGISKGYQFTEHLHNADFAISFTIGARDIIKPAQEPAILDGDWRWGNGYFGKDSQSNSGIQYAQGVLAIDIYDVRRKAPIWHGAGSKVMSEVKEDLSSIEPAVQKLLADFSA